MFQPNVAKSVIPSVGGTRAKVEKQGQIIESLYLACIKMCVREIFTQWTLKRKFCLMSRVKVAPRIVT